MAQDDDAVNELAAAVLDLSLSRAAQDVLDERARQISGEGYTAEHDDAHTGGELATAGVCYAMFSRSSTQPPGFPPLSWPWEPRIWRSGATRRMLVKAAALLLAEIERLDRKTARDAA